MFRLLEERTPFCFVRLNDGEMNAILKIDFPISRGDDISCVNMSKQLNNILIDECDDPNVFIGIPCKICYNDLYIHCMEVLTLHKSENFIANNVIDANILINNNYDNTLTKFMELLPDKNIIIIGNELADFSQLKKININANRTYAVSSKNAFKNDYDMLKNIDVEDGSVVLTLCGPLGRVLCYELYKKFKNSTFIDLGSFFDPLTRQISFLYHTNNHKHCDNCSPIIDKIGFTDIFNYCTNNVKKEAYYMGSLEDYESLYNYNYEKIINTLIIRLEYEKNYILYEILSKIFTKLCGIDYYLILVFISTLYNGCVNNVLGFNIPQIIVNYITINKNISITNLPNGDYPIEFPNEDKYNLVFYCYDNTIEVLNMLGSCYGKSNIDTLVVCKTLDSTFLDIFINQEILSIISNSDGVCIFRFIHDRPINVENFIKNSYYNDISPIVEEYFKNDSLNMSLYLTNMLINKILNYVKTQYCIGTEGYSFQCPNLIKDLIGINILYEPKHILEIGFNPGTSSLVFLLNSLSKLTTIDAVKTETTDYLIDLYNEIFDDGFRFIHGDAIEVLLNKYIYPDIDIVFIDGPHEYEYLLSIMIRLYDIVKSRTLIILNDVITNDDPLQVWNIGPTNVYNFLNKNGLINTTMAKTYGNGRGVTMFTFINFDTIHKKLSKNVFDVVVKYIPSLMKKYISVFNSITNNDEYYDLYINKHKNHIQKLEHLMRSRVDISVKNKAFECVKKHYKHPTTVDIPKIIHLIYINERPLKDYNYACINSVIDIMHNYHIIIHNDIPPIDKRWEALLKNDNVIVNNISRVKMYDYMPVNYVQYESDIIRLQILYKYGGIYMDTDMFMVKNITPIFDNNYSFYYCKEKSGALINCVMASVKKNGFIDYLLSGIKISLRNDIWAWHTRDFPKMILEKYIYLKSKYNIHILDSDNFCPIHWENMDILYDPNYIILENTYGIHLFETILKDRLNNCPLLVRYL